MDAVTLREFRRSGVVVVRGVLGVNELLVIRRQVDAYLDDEGAPVTEAGDGSSAPGRFAYGHDVLARVEAFIPVLRSSPLVPAVLSALGGTPPLTLLDDQVYVKEPGTEGRTPWHQDGSYWAVTGRALCSAWLALDDVDWTTGGLEFVAGSHLWPERFRAASFAEGQNVGDPAWLPVPDDAELRERHLVLAPALSAGDAVVFHASVLHGAGPNISRDRRRRAIVTRWAGADVRYAPRPYASGRQMDKARRNGVAAGAPFRGPGYPRFGTD
ncbi:phytanoyl-CoA dioxygenase family protein [Streptomyces sp. NBC_01558]|uniref:phytanoyl-CoA dioxygenase family protein n=1 Tax=Streptomyces sp. NBC_01558 TaxID=2975878 RepID=UPI002DD86E1A|nr:phytanoyl-CoA dioxygenase family protein [Streptomyces sp. NBC_01558]WSD75337.1 phytanoyl-CoA dioxygenase family protein [Streptomyces sp. NBC_01558]